MLRAPESVPVYICSNQSRLNLFVARLNSTMKQFAYKLNHANKYTTNGSKEAFSRFICIHDTTCLPSFRGKSHMNLSAVQNQQTKSKNNRQISEAKNRNKYHQYLKGQPVMSIKERGRRLMKQKNSNLEAIRRL